MQVSECVGIILGIFSICSAFVQVLVIIVVFYERKHVTNVFYTLYAIGSIADILSLIDAVFLYNSLIGFLNFQKLDSIFSAQLAHHIVWGARSSQLLTVLLIAINRFTAMYFPLKHPMIWCLKSELTCAFFQLTSIIINGFAATILLRPTWIESNYGGIAMLYDTLDGVRKPVFMCALVFQVMISLAITLCYAAIFRKYRSKMSFATDSSLYWIAVSICSIEILSIIQHTVSTQLNWTPETKTCLFIAQTVIYNSIPPCIFLAFSKNIRHRFYFTVLRHRPSFVVQLSNAFHFRRSSVSSTSTFL